MIKAAQAFASSFLIAFPVLVTVKDHIGTPYGVNGRSMQVGLISFIDGNSLGKTNFSSNE